MEREFGRARERRWLKTGPEEVEGLGSVVAGTGTLLPLEKILRYREVWKWGRKIEAVYVSGLGFWESWSKGHLLWVGMGKGIEDVRSRQMVWKSVYKMEYRITSNKWVTKKCWAPSWLYIYFDIHMYLCCSLPNYMFSCCRGTKTVSPPFSWYMSLSFSFLTKILKLLEFIWFK